MLWNSVITFLSQIIVKPRRSSGGRLHRIWSLWFSPSRCNWEDRQSCLQGSLFLSFCFSLLMSAIQNIVLEYIFIWTVGRNYFKLITMKSSQCVFNRLFLFLLLRSSQSQCPSFAHCFPAASQPQTTLRRHGLTFPQLSKSWKGKLDKLKMWSWSLTTEWSALTHTWHHSGWHNLWDFLVA